MRHLQQRLPLWASLVLFIALCASAAYWSLQLFKPPLRMVAAPPPPAQAELNLDAAASLFGGRMAPVAVASNFQLKGVVDAGIARESVAILSADGKPALAVRVGADLMPGVTVKEVHPRYVLLSDGGVIKRVELPDTAPPSTGNTPVASQPVTTPQFTPQPAPPPPQAFPPQPAPAPSVPPRVIYNAVPNATPPAVEPVSPPTNRVEAPPSS